MANKYSKYNLKPAVSTYVDPGSDEVMTLLRERYDKNKGKKDLIDRTLANTNVLEGDAHLLENTKNDIRGSLSGIIESGAYEKSGLVIDEAIASMETNEGLIGASKSYQNREEELKWQVEQNKAGKTILDFGKFDSKGHSSYNYNEETGKHDVNIYQAKSQPKLDWGGEMQTAWKGLKSNTWGINAKNIQSKVGGAYAVYLNSDAGQQHFRSLVELDYDESIPFEQRRAMAQEEIRKDLVGAGMMSVHELTPKASAVDKDRVKSYETFVNETASLSGDNLELTVASGSSFSTSVAYPLQGLGPGLINQGNVHNAIQSAVVATWQGDDPLGAQKRHDALVTWDRTIEGLVEKELLPPAAIADLKWRDNGPIWKRMSDAGWSEDKIAMSKALIGLSTTKGHIGELQTVDPYMREALEGNRGFGASGATATATGLATQLTGHIGKGMFSKGIMNTIATGVHTAGKGLALGAGTVTSGKVLGDMIYGGLKTIYDSTQKGSVRGRPLEGSGFGNFIDTQKAQLSENLTDLDWVNKVFANTISKNPKLKFTAADRDILKHAGLDVLQFQQDKGDDYDKIINEHFDEAVDYPTFRPQDIAKFAKQKTILDATDLHQYRIIDGAEGSPLWDAVTENGTKISGFSGGEMIPPSLKYSTHRRFSFIAHNEDGDVKFNAEMKPEGRSKYPNLNQTLDQIGGSLHFSVLERAIDMLADTPAPSLAETSTAIKSATDDIVSKMPNFGEGLGEEQGQFVEEAKKRAYRSSMFNIMMEIPQTKEMILNQDKSIRAALKDKDGPLYTVTKDASGKEVVNRNISPSGMDEKTRALYNLHFSRALYGDTNSGGTNKGFVGLTNIAIR